MKVVIPVKGNSTRCRRKNFRPFCHGQSLLEVKISQVLDALPANDIYIASESEEAGRISERLGVNFLLREEYTTKDDCGWSDVLLYLESIVPGDDDLALVCATTPLFNAFAGVFSKWEQVHAEHDSLLVAAPLKHYLLTHDGRPVNFQFGHWHQWSQSLETLYVFQWPCTIAKRETIRRYSYFIGSKPYLWESTGLEIDIDTEEEFDAAVALYEAKLRRSAASPGEPDGARAAN